jgi:phage/plasmid-associated DNA primase
MLYILGSYLSGQSYKDQNSLVHYGHGSAGKSTLLMLLKVVLGSNYVKSLPYDIFEINNKNQNKLMNSFTSNGRYYIVNELKNSKVETSIIKQICDGEIDTTKLFKDGSFNI